MFKKVLNFLISIFAVEACEDCPYYVKGNHCSKINDDCISVTSDCYIRKDWKL